MTELIAKTREELGRKSHLVRKSGSIPAILYGYETNPKPLSVDSRVFEKALKEAGESSIVTLTVEGDKTYNVLIQDVALDPISDNPIHVDFYAVRMDKPIEATVVLSFVGESEAVRALGGVLVRVIQEVEVRALPKDLPHEIEVSIKSLHTFGTQILIKDVLAPTGVEILVGDDQVVALVEAPRTEEELAALDEAPTDTSIENIEVAGKKPEDSDEESPEESKE